MDVFSAAVKMMVVFKNCSSCKCCYFCAIKKTASYLLCWRRSSSGADPDPHQFCSVLKNELVSKQSVTVTVDNDTLVAREMCFTNAAAKCCVVCAAVWVFGFLQLLLLLP